MYLGGVHLLRSYFYGQREEHISLSFSLPRRDGYPIFWFNNYSKLGLPTAAFSEDYHRRG